MPPNQTKVPNRAIPIEEFDPDRLVFLDPEQVEGATPFTKSDVRYRYEDDVVGYCNLMLPPGFTFGVNAKHKFGADRIPENETGKFQMAYSCTKRDTKDDPTELERAVLDLDPKFHKKACEFLVSQKDELDDLYPTLKMGGMSGADSILSHLLTPPTKPDPNSKGLKKKRIPDDTKTFMWYIKMWQRKDNSFKTKMYGPGDVLVSPLSYRDQMGTVEPLVRIEWLHFGKEITPQCYIIQANFVPGGGEEDVPRLLPPNRAPVVDAPDLSHPEEDRPDEPEAGNPPASEQEEREEDKAPQPRAATTKTIRKQVRRKQ